MPLPRLVGEGVAAARRPVAQAEPVGVRAGAPPAAKEVSHNKWGARELGMLASDSGVPSTST